MQGTNTSRMRGDMPHATFFLPSFPGLIVLLVFSFGCGGPPSSPVGGGPSASSNDSLELTDEMIHERINESWVRDVPSEDGTGEPITWGFRRNEPKEITIVDKQVEATRATVVLDIKTQTTPRSRPQRQLAGQIRTEWELKSGWALRKWRIVNTENISMKYRNLPNPPADNSNLPGSVDNTDPPKPPAPNSNR